MSYIKLAEALASQDARGNVGVRLNTYDEVAGRWTYSMIDADLAVKLGGQLIRMGQNAITSNQLRDDPSHLIVMRERAGLSS